MQVFGVSLVALWTIVAAGGMLVGGCATGGASQGGLTQGRVEAAVSPPGEMRLEVRRSERQLYVYVDGEVVESHPVAVGQPEYPTPRGEWAIFQIDWNPDWTPPDSDWAAGEEYRAPGEAGNPMGRARLMFNPPYTIHGTEALESLGTAASHGSIRVSNEVAIRLGRMLMAYGGAAQDDAWVDRALEDPTVMHTIELSAPVPIRVTD